MPRLVRQKTIACSGLLALEQLDEQVEFLLVVDREVELLDRLDGLGLGREVHHLGVAHVRAGQPFDRRGDRGAQQQRLPLLGAAAEDFFDVGPEADVEHPVGLVEHDDLEVAQIERAAADEVEHAAGRADDDLGPAAAVCRSGRGSACRRRPARSRIRRPWASLSNSSRTCTASSRVGTSTSACGGDAFAAVLEPFEDRNGEGGRLAGAGAGLAQHVDAGQRAGNDAGLNRRGLEDTRPARATRASTSDSPNSSKARRTAAVGRLFVVRRKATCRGRIE